ncbi:hypothetical protein FK531_03060 [Rhodococcus spelaei]|uniref:DUF6779 domain-containing protein n=1 Tax=Rhodococcus spelaei TaxID=2546320 RepID=A0A541BRT6_9NOCA|nr:DUF6779 domain-containing protein [Rhodococcus spelaei]TQF75043.1 hypothetical protein FK531_03060 [Rhodococcus spelaei]
MTVSGRVGSLRRGKRNASQMIVAGLVVLAVVASLFLIFSDSIQLLRVGVVIALWAATLGALAMTKYRRESALDKAKVRDLQTVYELQLEREITARREYESGVEARVRSETNLDVSEIAALRAELAALRGSLEVLFEGKMPVDRVALTADATRVPELGSGVRGPYAPPRTFTPEPSYTDPTSGPTFATPFDEPVTAEVSVVADPVPEPAPRRVAEPVPAPRPVADPVAAAPSPVAAPAVATPRPVVEATTTTPARPEPKQTPAPAPTPAPAVAETVTAEPVGTSGGRRRRADPDEDDTQPEDAAPGAHSSGLSVAEIMANMKSAQPESDGSRPGRRRRN